MTPERRREIASAGGKASHRRGTAHEFTSEEARAAGVKGGRAVADARGSGHMAAIGRKGGRARQRKRAQLPLPLDPEPAPDNDSTSV